jgi:hypothetical protein
MVNRAGKVGDGEVRIVVVSYGQIDREYIDIFWNIAAHSLALRACTSHF